MFTKSQAGPCVSRSSAISGNCSRKQTGRQISQRCQAAPLSSGKLYVDPVHKEMTAFAPATVANLGPGFDWMGCAVQGGGDTVTARVLHDRPGELIIERIEGDSGRLSLDPAKNCIGVAARETLRLIGQPSCGVALTLHKGLPLGSGLGSSAASAAAAAWAVNGLFGSPLSKSALVLPGVLSEASVSGYHADNVAPAILGGFILIRSCLPGQAVDLLQLPFSPTVPLYFVLVNPVFEAPTAEMRAVLPQMVPMKSMINNCCQGGTLVAGILTGDVRLIGEALDRDMIIEPVRGPLIPGMMAVKEAARAAGAFGCTISGAGPTAVAIVDSLETGHRVAEAMGRAFKTHGKLDINSSKIVQLDPVGAMFL
ncbi:MAG: hypothetical protein WDW38_006906 [Sanguina aurantia]